MVNPTPAFQKMVSAQWTSLLRRVGLKLCRVSPESPCSSFPPCKISSVIPLNGSAALIPTADHCAHHHASVGNVRLSNVPARISNQNRPLFICGTWGFALENSALFGFLGLQQAVMPRSLAAARRYDTTGCAGTFFSLQTLTDSLILVTVRACACLRGPCRLPEVIVGC